jgi:hypothetical protein
MFAEDLVNYYQQTYPERPCGHSSLLFITSRGWAEVFCGLCWLQEAWECEFPRRFHEYKLLAENGNPETSPGFWSHLKANLGLIPPEHGEDLRAYRLARKRLYGEPGKNKFPVAHALYEVMGVQPKLATPLTLYLCGASPDFIRKEMKMTSYGLHQSWAKGTRMVIRKIVKDD